MVEWGLNRITKKICFYISDHGYGHAARDIAIIRRLQNNLDLNIFIKTLMPINFVRQSLPWTKLIECLNDEGVILQKNFPKVDEKETLNLFEKWIQNWEDYIEKEKQFCKENNIDLIISDIAPQPFLVAKEIGIPSIAISNFTWHSVFSHIYGDNQITRTLKDAYKSATLACLLPFREPMKVFRKRFPVSLVSRNINVTKSEFRKSLGIKENEKLIYVGLGKSMDEKILSNLTRIDRPDTRLLLPSGAKLPSKKNIKIPRDYTETQNYLGACDLIVSKAGYSTVSEAVRAKIPVFIFERENFHEDIFVRNELKKLKIGEVITFEEFINCDWIDKIEDLKKYKENFNNLRGEYTEDGCAGITNIIKEALD